MFWIESLHNVKPLAEKLCLIRYKKSPSVFLKIRKIIIHTAYIR